MTEPELQPRADGIYPRCVWCRTELYVLAVVDYSTRVCPCPRCGRMLPEDYPITPPEPEP